MIELPEGRTSHGDGSAATRHGDGSTVLFYLDKIRQ